MKLRWNEELKKVFLCLCIFVALSLVLLNLGLGIFRNQMRRDYTTLAAGVLENVLRLYPQVSEEELLQLLDQPETTGEGEALLARMESLQNMAAAPWRVRKSGCIFLCWA